MTRLLRGSTALCGAMLIATPALAQEAAPAQDAAAAAAPGAQEATGDAIVVTGSLIRRTDTETPSPVTVLSAETLEQRGLNTVTEAVQRLSAGNAGTITQGWNAGGNFAAGASAISLRGLTVQATLTLFDGLRLLVLIQALVAALAWVLAVPLFELIGADPRGIFAFRHTSAGAVFHLVAIGATVVLSYYDLFARVVLIWVSFALASALATWLQWEAGFAAFGWGYMAGAVVGASVGIAMVAESTVRLVYLLFVGNNPAVVGREGRWA